MPINLAKKFRKGFSDINQSFSNSFSNGIFPQDTNFTNECEKSVFFHVLVVLTSSKFFSKFTKSISKRNKRIGMISKLIRCRTNSAHFTLLSPRH